MSRRPALALGALVALAAAPTPYAPGISFTIKSSTTVDGVTSPSGAGTRVQGLNGILRFESDDTKQGSGGKGSYTIVNPAAKTLLMIMPDSKQYIEFNWGDSTGQALGAMASAMAAATVVSDIEVSGTSLGGGGSVNGYNTNHYRINTSFAEVSDGTEGQRKVRMVEDFWVTSELKDIPDPMEAFTRAFGGQSGLPQMRGTMGDLMRKRGDVQRKLFTGLPIKSVVKTTSTERDGKTTEQTSITEILDLKRVDLDASAFGIPAGYTKMDMKAFLNIENQLRNAARNQAQQAVDETKQETKDAAKEAAKGEAEAAKQGAKEKAKCALGGMFGKKC